MRNPNKFTLKTPQYGNCKVVSNDGILMFRCDEKKINWYLTRNLAEVICEDPKTIKLKFTPNGLGHAGDDYFLGEKHNKCVVCGETKFLTKHHVVPKNYRKWFPENIKSHFCHDIVSLCFVCHEKYESVAIYLKMEIAKEYNMPVNGFRCNDTNALKAKKNIHALITHKDKIPADRFKILKARVEEYFGEEIYDFEKAETKIINDLKAVNVENHGQYVIVNLKESLESFVIRWRKHFISCMEPKYLPSGWDVERPLDRR